MTDEKLEKIDDCDIRIDDVELIKMPREMSYVLVCRGWSTPKVQYLKEYQDDFVVSGDMYGKRIGYNMKIPIELMYEYDQNKLIDYVLNCIPPKLKNGYNEHKIIGAIYENSRKLWK